MDQASAEQSMRYEMLERDMRRRTPTNLVRVSLQSPAAEWSQGPPWRRWGGKGRWDYRNNTSSSVWSWWWRWCPGRARGNTHRSPHFSLQEHLARSMLTLQCSPGTTVLQVSNLPITSHSPFWMKVLMSPPSSESNFKSSWKLYFGEKMNLFNRVILYFHILLFLELQIPKY